MLPAKGYISLKDVNSSTNVDHKLKLNGIASCHSAQFRAPWILRVREGKYLASSISTQRFAETEEDQASECTESNI
jgi:hypothetical protein